MEDMYISGLLLSPKGPNLGDEVIRKRGRSAQAQNNHVNVDDVP